MKKGTGLLILIIGLVMIGYGISISTEVDEDLYNKVRYTDFAPDLIIADDVKSKRTKRKSFIICGFIVTVIGIGKIIKTKTL